MKNNTPRFDTDNGRIAIEESGNAGKNSTDNSAVADHSEGESIVKTNLDDDFGE